MKTLGIMSILLVVLLAMPGCNTIKGAGQDVESVGDALEDAVN